MAIAIKKGMDIKLEGAPAPTLLREVSGRRVSVLPSEFDRIKPRLVVKAGDAIKRGSPLFHDKKNPAFCVCSPVSGTVEAVNLGPRRVIEQIVLATNGKDEAETFPSHTLEQISGLSKEAAMALLQQTGLWALIRQRPFSRMADPAAQPKAIFVNAMNTAPFQADIQVAVRGDEAAFEAGLRLLTRLAEVPVHLCVQAGAPELPGAGHVRVHPFKGPHPSGNTSVHIHHIAPLQKGETVWTIRAVDLILLGKLVTEGRMPSTRVVALGGPGVRPEARGYYRVRVGTLLKDWLADKLNAGEQRIIAGDVLSGEAVTLNDALRWRDSSFTILPENRERSFLGWLAPGFNLFSRSRAFAAAWLPRQRPWALDTSQHGELRPMILTGLYDRYLPMNIMTDFLIRAVLAHDTEEAIQLGILETDPEDFALCAMVCPSKMDLPGLIRQGLEEIEKEGF